MNDGLSDSVTTLSTPKYFAYADAGWDWTKRPHMAGLLHGDTLAVEVRPGTARECHHHEPEPLAQQAPRLQAGRPARPLLFTGIRGVGKTAILTIARRAAADIRLPLVRLEASRRGALLEDIAFQLDAILTTLSSRRDATRRALEDLAEFKLGVQVARSGVEIAGRRREPIVGSLESRFQRLLASVATAAADAGAPLVVVIDELQQGLGDLLGPLLSALHLANQDEIQLDESTIEVHVVEVHEGGTKVCNVTCDPASRRTNRKRAGDQLSGQPHPLSDISRTRTTVRTPRSSGTCDGHS